MFQTAAKIKGAQTAQDRKQFETWPQYLQETLFGSEKPEVQARRAAPLSDRLAAAVALKEEAKELFLRAGDAHARQLDSLPAAEVQAVIAARSAPAEEGGSAEYRPPALTGEESKAEDIMQRLAYVNTALKKFVRL